MNFGMRLNRRRNVRQMISGHCLLNSQHETFLRCAEQELQILRNLPYGNGDRGIAIVVAIADSIVNAENVSFSECSLGWNSVDNLFVDRCTQRRREAMISLESGAAPMFSGHIFGYTVKFQRCDAWLAHGLQRCQHLMNNEIRLAQNLDFLS